PQSQCSWLPPSPPLPRKGGESRLYRVARPRPGMTARPSLPLCARDAFRDQLVRILGPAPAQHLDPFAGLEILVVLEEMLDLLQRDFGQVAIAPHLVVALGQL